MKVGKAKPVLVRLAPTTTTQSVLVTLAVSSPHGYQNIASRTLTIPAGELGLTLRFRWAPTAKQAALGKVTVRATIALTDPNMHDTNPSNNELISKPFRIFRS